MLLLMIVVPVLVSIFPGILSINLLTKRREKKTKAVVGVLGSMNIDRVQICDNYHNNAAM